MHCGMPSAELRADLVTVLAVVQLNGTALADASEEHRSDHEIVLAAMQQHGGALKCASEEFRADHVIVRVTVQGLEVRCNMHSRCSALTTRSFWRPCCDSAVALSAVEKHGLSVKMDSEGQGAGLRLALMSL